MTSVLVVGEAIVDVIVSPDGSTTERPGGSPANVAVGLGRLGHDVRLLTALGNDDRGHLLRDHLQRSGVDVVAHEIPRTSTAVATIDSDGNAHYELDIHWEVPDVDLRADWLHVGSIASVLRPGADAVLRLAQAQRAAGAVSFDPNCRPGFRDVDRVEELVALSTVTKLSEEDLGWLYPDGEPDWLTRGHVVVTRGGRGATAYRGDERVDTAPASGGPVVDTVGAGDAFMAGLIDGLIRELPDPLAHAAVVARHTVERPGADPPWLADLAGA